MTKLDRIQKLLETEDPPLTEALIRKGAYQQCLNILQEKNAVSS